MKQVRVLDNMGQEYTYPIDRPVAEITIGRSQGNDIILGSKTVSRRHAILKIMGDRVLVVNQSPNGLLVGAERIDHVRELAPGEVVTLDVYRISVDGMGGAPVMAPPGPAPMAAVSGPSPYGAPPGPPPSMPVAGPMIGVNPSIAAPMAPPVAQPMRPPQPAAPQIAPKPAMPTTRKVKRTPEQEQASFTDYVRFMFPHAGQEEARVNLSGTQVQPIDRKRRQALVEFKSKLHDELKERLDLHSFEITDYRNPRVIRQVSGKLKELIDAFSHEIPPPYTKDDTFKELMDEVCGLGPIEDLVKHKKVSEIMVVDRSHVYAELGGKIVLTDRFFNDEKSMMTVIERIVVPRGRRIDESTPLVDTRLADGSRVNAVIPPLALKDPCLTIRKFPESRLSIEDLVKFGSMTFDMAKFIGRAVRIRKNIIISGGTGSGKTTLLNVMSSFIGPKERVVTIEDAAELQLQQEHVVSLETKPPNLEGKGEISIRDLVKNALRMRPDRVVVGECRGGEALDMLQAMNTGHDGSMTTVHSNSPVEAISRLETLVLMSGMELPTRAIREQMANSVNLIVQQTRFSDGSRRITYISEVVGIDDDGFIRIEDIFIYKQTGMNEKGKVQGYHMATGYLPTFLYDFVINGVATENDFF
jgi:pilus assembly protein CpaF